MSLAREWVGEELLKDADENDPAFRMRRWDEWSNAMSNPAVKDLFHEMRTVRDEVVGQLIAGTPNRYHERGDDEKRAMIHVLNTILRFPDGVRRDAEKAKRALDMAMSRIVGH